MAHIFIEVTGRLRAAAEKDALIAKDEAAATLHAGTGGGPPQKTTGADLNVLKVRIGGSFDLHKEKITNLATTIKTDLSECNLKFEAFPYETMDREISAILTDEKEKLSRASEAGLQHTDECQPRVATVHTPRTMPHPNTDPDLRNIRALGEPGTWCAEFS